MSNESFNTFHFRKCPVCKKTFPVEVSEMWAYKRQLRGGPVLFCSWKCFREYEKKHPFKPGWITGGGYNERY